MKANVTNPHNYHTRFTLAVIYHKDHRSREAVEMYQEVLHINPDHAAAYKNLGILYLNEIKDYDKALNSLRKSIILAPHQEQAAEMKSVIKRLTTELERKR